MIDEAAARRFIYANGRVLERRVYASLFEGADTSGVVGSLLGFRNPDGGFGHGLEPDKRVPDSQPLDVEIAFERLAMVHADAGDLVEAACDWLETVADDRGAVPVLLPSSNQYPRAGHWNAAEYPPDVNPTAAIAAHVHSLGVSHSWADDATDCCLSLLVAGAVPDEGHALLAVTKLLAAIPDRDRAEALAPLVSDAIKTASFVKYVANSDSYGVTPLDFAPTPDSFARGWFPDDVIAGHLESLEAEQAADGGWNIAWDPPGEGARSEWRGIRTLHALRTLKAYAS